MTFWSDATPQARRALLAAAAGWMLDAMDVLLYAFVLGYLGGRLIAGIYNTLVASKG